MHVDKWFDIWSTPTTQKYGSISIATVVLCSWGRPYVRWTRWRNISAFAFAAANCMKISTEWWSLGDWQYWEKHMWQLCCWASLENKVCVALLPYGVERLESDWGTKPGQNAHFEVPSTHTFFSSSKWANHWECSSGPTSGAQSAPTFLSVSS